MKYRMNTIKIIGLAGWTQSIDSTRLPPTDDPQVLIRFAILFALHESHLHRSDLLRAEIVYSIVPLAGEDTESTK